MYTVRVVRRSANNNCSEYKFDKRSQAVEFLTSLNAFIPGQGNTIQRIRTQNLYILGLK